MFISLWCMLTMIWNYFHTSAALKTSQEELARLTFSKAANTAYRRGTMREGNWLVSYLGKGWVSTFRDFLCNKSYFHFTFPISSAKCNEFSLSIQRLLLFLILAHSILNPSITEALTKHLPFPAAGALWRRWSVLQPTEFFPGSE